VELTAQCCKEYQAKLSKLGSPDAIDAWVRTLEDDLSEIHDLEPDGIAARRVLKIEKELLEVVFHHCLLQSLAVHSQFPLGQARCTPSRACAIFHMLHKSLQPSFTSYVWSWGGLEGDAIRAGGQQAAPPASNYAK